jgi:hypothetical protein
MAKVTESDSVEISAGSSDPNVLDNTRVENVPTDDDYLVRLLSQADDLDVRHTLEVDSQVAVQKSVVGSNGGRPVRPDDIITEVPVEGGSKLYLAVENQDNNNPHNYIYTVELIPLSMAR